MNVLVQTQFNPFRLDLQKNHSVQFSAEVTNREDEAKLLSMDILTTRELSFDKTGLQSQIKKKLDTLEPNQTIKMYFDLYPRSNIMPGEYPVEVVVKEHYKEYGYVVYQKKIRSILRVE